jgi:biopolymer transport protein ExbD
MDQLSIFHKALTEAGIDKIRYSRSEGEGLTVQMPPQKAIDRLEEMPGNLIIDVAVRANGDISVGTRKVKAGELTSAVKERLDETPTGIVVINNDKATSYGDFTKVLALVKDAGAERVVVKFGKEE